LRLFAQPGELTPIEAVRAAARVAFGSFSADERDVDQVRQELVLGVPELAAATLNQVRGTIDALAGALADRCDAPALDIRLFADEGTEFWKLCFDLLDLHGGPDHDEQALDFLQSAHAHIMGRTAYEGMAASLPANPDNPWAGILTAGRKVVFSRTMETADWANTTTIAAGDTAEEIDKLRLGGDGHIVVWGGVSLWRSLMRLDLIDDFHLSLYPYVADEGTLLFDDVPKSYRLDLVSSTANSVGVVELQYRRHR
jgi:dihydrofolate reductase